MRITLGLKNLVCYSRVYVLSDSIMVKFNCNRVNYAVVLVLYFVC